MSRCPWSFLPNGWKSYNFSNRKIIANTCTQSTKEALHSATKAFLFQCSFSGVLFSWSLFQYHDSSTYSPADTNPLPEIAGLMTRGLWKNHWFPSRGVRGYGIYGCAALPQGRWNHLAADFISGILIRWKCWRVDTRYPWTGRQLTHGPAVEPP